MAPVGKRETALGQRVGCSKFAVQADRTQAFPACQVGALTSPTRDPIDMRGKLIFLQDQSQPILSLFQARDLDGDISDAGYCLWPGRPRLEAPLQCIPVWVGDPWSRIGTSLIRPARRPFIGGSDARVIMGKDEKNLFALCSRPSSSCLGRLGRGGGREAHGSAPAQRGDSHHPFDKVASGSYIRVMRSVGLKTLKNKLSEYVRLAAGGETVLVTDRDRVVAEIGPPNPARSPLLSDALLLDAFRQGWMTPPISVGRGPPARKPVMMIDELLSNLQRDRTDR
jgi:antitoxin (DNA-binding transcriptional repressor) of toxin-antitoxin stability system